MQDNVKWDEFRESGLLWWVNRIIHTFGWAIHVHVGDDGKVTRAYPDKVTYAGFDRDDEEDGFKKIWSTFIK